MQIFSFERYLYFVRSWLDPNLEFGILKYLGYQIPKIVAFGISARSINTRVISAPRVFCDTNKEPELVPWE